MGLPEELKSAPSLTQELYPNPTSAAPNPGDILGAGKQPNTLDLYNDSMMEAANSLFSKPISEGTKYKSVGFNAEEVGLDRYANSNYFKQLGIDLNGNNEESYGMYQTKGNKLSNALGGAWELIKNQFVEQATSWDDTLDMFMPNHEVFKQSEMEEIAKQQNEIFNKNAIFQTQEDQEGILNFNTVANVIQQSGYAVGAVAEILAEEAVLSALTALTLGGTSGIQAARTAQHAASVAKVLNKTNEAIKLLNSPSRLRKIFNSVKNSIPLTNTLDFAGDAVNIARESGKAKTVAKGFGAFYRDVRELNAAVSEAKAEAAGTQDELQKQFLQDFKDKNGRQPEPHELDHIKRIALTAAQTNGASNTALIMASNKMGLGNVFGGFKSMRHITDNFGDGILAVSDKMAKKTGEKLIDANTNKWLAFKRTLVTSPLTYTKTNLTEALQENAQGMSNDAVKAYYEAQYADADDPSNTWSKHLTKAALNQFNTEGAKTFLSGFMTGSIISGLNKVGAGAGRLANMATAFDEYKSRKEGAETERQEIIKAYNAIYKDPLSFDYKDSKDAPVQANFKSILAEAVKNNDTKTFDDIQDDSVRKLVLTGIRTGTLDSLTQRMEDYIKELKPDEFTTAFGLEHNETSVAEVTNQVRNFQERAREIKTAHEKASDKLKNPFNPFKYTEKQRKDLDPEYVKEALSYKAWNNAVDGLVFTKDLYKQTLVKQKKALQDIQKIEGFSQVPFNSIMTLTSLDNLAAEVDILDKEIENLSHSTDVKSKEILAGKKALLSTLENYYESFRSLEEESTDGSGLESNPKHRKQMILTFAKYINAVQKNGKGDQVTYDAMEEAFDNLDKFYKLNKESGVLIQNVNLLADPKGFSNYFQSHQTEIRSHYSRRVAEVEKNPIVSNEPEAPVEPPLDPAKVELREKIFKIVNNDETYNRWSNKKDGSDKLEFFDFLKQRIDILLSGNFDSITKDDEDRKLFGEKAFKAIIDLLRSEADNAKLPEGDLKQNPGMFKTVDEVKSAAATLIAFNRGQGSTLTEEELIQKVMMEWLNDPQLADSDRPLVEQAFKELMEEETGDEIIIPEAPRLQGTPEEISQPIALSPETPTAPPIVQEEVLEQIKNADTEGELNLAITELAGEEISPEIKNAIDEKEKELQTPVEEVVVDPEKEYEEVEKVEQLKRNEDHGFNAKTDTPFSSTNVETLNYDSEDVDPDPVKRTYFNAINKLRRLSAGVNYSTLKIGNREGVFVKAVKGDTIPDNNLEGETLKAINSGKYTRKQQAESVVLILVDKDGEPYRFNEAGEVVDNGLLAVTSMRKPVFNDKTKRFELLNVWGENQIQSPHDIAAKIVKAGGLTVDGKLETEAEIIAEYIDKSQQKEFQDLDSMRDLVVFHDKDLMYPIKQITEGQAKKDFKNPSPISSVHFPVFDPKTVKHEDDATRGRVMGGVYVDHPNAGPVLLVRPYVPADIMDVIETLVFDDTRIDALDKIQYLRTVLYTESKKLWFEVKDDKVVVQIDGERLKNDPEGRIKLRNFLKTKKLNISDASIGKNFPNYKVLMGKIITDPVEYNEFLNDRMLTYYKTNNGDIVLRNAYIKYDESDETVFDNSPEEVEEAAPVETKPVEVKEPEKVLTPEERRQAIMDEPLFKLRSVSNYATVGEIEDAKKWFDNSPLSKYVPFQQLFDVVNSDAIAQWTQHGIVLFHGSNYTDIYHEAFHGFSQLFLTPEQKVELYNDVAKIYPGKTDLQLEEILAEDFRKYVLSGGQLVLDKQYKRNTIFRKIYNFLKSLFTGVKYSDYLQRSESYDKIKALYDNLYKGNFNEVRPDLKNIRFGKLNKGVESNGESLSNAESILLRETIDSLIRQIMHKRYTPTLLFEKPELKKKVYERVLALLKVKQEQAVDPLQKKILDFAVKHPNPVFTYHGTQSKYLNFGKSIADIFDDNGNIQERVEEDDDSNHERDRDSAFGLSGNEKSMKEMASNEVLYLISGMFQVDKNGKQVMNELGEPKLIDFDLVWNRLIKTLQGTLDDVSMYKKLVANIKNYPEFAQLVVELGDPSEGIKTDEQFNLWTRFRQDMSKVRVAILNAQVEKTENGVTFKVEEARPDNKKVAKNFTNNFQQALDSPYIRVNAQGSNALNVPAVLAAFAEQKTKQNGDSYFVIKDDKKIEFLNALGFVFSDKDEIKRQLEEFNRATRLLDVIMVMHNNKMDIINPIDQIQTKVQHPDTGQFLTSGERGTINTLLDIESKYSDDYSNYSVTNAEGNKEWEHSLQSMLTINTSMLNDADKYPTYQHLIREPEMQRYDVVGNPIAKGSIILNSLFNLTPGDKNYGKRRLNKDGTHVTVDPVNLGGVVVIDNKLGGAKDGVKTRSLDIQGKFLFDFNMLLTRGIVEMPRVESKGTYLGLKTSTLHDPSGTGNNKFNYLYFSLTKFKVTKDAPLHSSIVDAVNGYLMSEMERIRGAYKGVGGDIQGYNTRAKNFSLFDGILKDTTKTELIRAATAEENIIESTVEKLRSTLAVEYANYFKKLEEEHRILLNENPLIDTTLLDEMGAFYKDIAKQELTLPQKTEILLKAYTVNAWIANVEAVKLVHGDIAFYKTDKDEYHKRIPGSVSTGTTSAVSTPIMDWINENSKAKGRAKYLRLTHEVNRKWDGTFNTVVFEDVSPDSIYAGRYAEVFEKDYINKFIRAEERDPTEEELVEIKAKAVKKASAYTSDGIKEGDGQGWITLDGWRIHKMSQGQWTPELTKLYDKAVRGEELNDNEHEAFSVVKAQYFGQVKTDTGLFIPAMHKFSLVPLVPSMIKGTNMEAIERNLIDKGIDYALFASGSKVATVGKPNPFYQPGPDGKVDFKNRVPYTGNYIVNTIYNRYLREQVAISTHFHNDVIFSTQMRKLIELGLFGEGKENIPNAAALIKRYEDAIDLLSKIKKDELIRQTGIEFIDNKYVINDYTKIVALIHKEFVQRELPDHITEFIDLTKDGKLKTPLDLSTQTQVIEKVIQSIVNNRLVRQKVNGEPLIQVAGSGFETGSMYKIADDDVKEKWSHEGTNELRFYEPGPDGKTLPAQCKIALNGDFKNLLQLMHPDGLIIGTRDRLNDLIKDEEWLNKDDNRKKITIAGPRIPVQGLNSMEFMEVRHFLPNEAGPIIILPTEIVAKSGGDYDVDKLNIFLPSIAASGKYMVNRYKTSDEVNEVLDKEIKSKRKLMDEVKSYIATHRQEIKFVKNIKDSEIKQIRQYREYAKIERDIYLNEIKDILDSINYRDDLADYRNVSIDNLFDKMLNLSRERDIKELDENLYKYYELLQGIDNTYKEYNQIVQTYELIKQDNLNTIQEVRTEELKELFDYSDRIRDLFEERRNLTKSAENEIIQSMKAILELEENFVDLVSPNSTELVEPLSIKTARRMSTYNPYVSKVTGQNTGILSPSLVAEPRYNFAKFQENNVAKAALGVGAKFNTFHPLFQKSGAYLNLGYYKGEKYIPVKVYLPFNEKIIEVEKEGKISSNIHISLSHLLDSEGKNTIQEITSQLMNGWVDAGKKAWIFNINGGMETAPIILLLNAMGTPVDINVDFVTQGVIVKYTKRLSEKNNLIAKTMNPDYHKYYKNNVRLDMIFELLPELAPYKNKIKGLGSLRDVLNTGVVRLSKKKSVHVFKTPPVHAVKDKIFTRDFLRNTDVTPPNRIEQAVLLYQFFELEELSAGVRDIQTALDFDTSRSKDPVESQIKIDKFQDALEKDLMPKEVLYSMRNDSVIKSFAVQKFTVDFQQQLLPLRNNTELTKFILDSVEELEIERRSSLKDKFIRTMKNDFIQYLFQNYALPQSYDIPSKFFGTDTMAHQLVKMKAKYPKLMEDFAVVRSLVGDPSKKHPLLWNVRLNDSTLDTPKINVYHDEFTRLVDPDVKKSDNPQENEEITKFFTDLAIFGFLQTGLNKNFLSFTEVIPQSLYTRMMEETVKKFSGDGMHIEELWRFHEMFRDENSATFPIMMNFGQGLERINITNPEPTRFKLYREQTVNRFPPKFTKTQLSSEDVFEAQYDEDFGDSDESFDNWTVPDEPEEAIEPTQQEENKVVTVVESDKNFTEKIVDYANKLIPNHIKNNNDTLSLVSEFKSLQMLSTKPSTKEELIKGKDSALGALNEWKKGNKDLTPHLNNIIANIVLGQLAKQGMSETDIWNNLFGKKEEIVANTGLAMQADNKAPETLIPQGEVKPVDPKVEAATEAFVKDSLDKYDHDYTFIDVEKLKLVDKINEDGFFEQSDKYLSSISTPITSANYDYAKELVAKHGTSVIADDLGETSLKSIREYMGSHVTKEGIEYGDLGAMLDEYIKGTYEAEDKQEIEDILNKYKLLTAPVDPNQLSLFPEETAAKFVRSDTIINRAFVKANPDTLFLFGDNTKRTGLGGQAKEMRGEPNAVGVLTKKLPERGDNAYLSDAELEDNKRKIGNDIALVISHWKTGKYKKMHVPPMGVGLAELPTRAPKTWEFLQSELKRLEDIVNGVTPDEVRTEQPAQPKQPASNDVKLFDPTDKQLRRGSVVEYDGKKFLFWNNNEGRAQLINTDGTKFSGTPNIDKLKVLGAYETTNYIGTEYIVTDNNNIYSGANGNLVFTAEDAGTKGKKDKIIKLAKFQKLEGGADNVQFNRRDFTEDIQELINNGIIKKQCD